MEDRTVFVEGEETGGFVGGIIGIAVDIAVEGEQVVVQEEQFLGMSAFSSLELNEVFPFPVHPSFPAHQSKHKQ